MNKKIDQDNIQYKILKSEACGHTIEYKMVKKEHELEKARVDEGKSPREKMKAREERSSKEREPRELNPEQYETAKKIARTKAVTATGEKQRKETLKDALHTHKQKNKSPSKEDLEYPMAASEKECKCEDKTEKCECEDKEMKKREKFYIQKIQELRKQSQLDLPLQGGSLRDRPIKEIPRVLGSKLKTGAKDIGSRLGERVSNLASRAGNVTPNQIAQGVRNAPNQIAQGASKVASRIGASGAGQLARQGATRAATALGPAGQLYGAFEGGRAVGDYVANPLIDKYTTETNKYGEKSNAVERGMGKLGSLLPESIGGISEQQYQQSYGDPSASNATAEQKAKQNYAASPAARDRQAAKENIGVNPKMPDYNKLAVDPADIAPAGAAPAGAAPTKPQSFGEAFKAARSARMGGTGKDTFDFGGKQYHSFTKDDFAQGIGNKYNPELRQQQKSIKSSPVIPNTETAPSTNPMKPADQGSIKLRPDALSLEEKQKQFS